MDPSRRTRPPPPRCGSWPTPGQSADLCRAAHRLRGAGGSFGFPPISDAAKAVEDRLTAGQPTTAAAAEVDALLGVIRRVDGYAAAA